MLNIPKPEKPETKEYYVGLTDETGPFPGNTQADTDSADATTKNLPNPQPKATPAQPPTPNRNEQQSTTAPTPKDQPIGIPTEKTASDSSPPLALSKENLADLLSSGQQPAYESRSESGRKQAIAKYGGTQQSENSVELGLKWLMQHQDTDGKWDASDFTRHCHDKLCDGPGQRRYTPGLTALVCLSFLAAGYTPQQGRYREQLANTEKYLLGLSNQESWFVTQELYSQAIRLLALTELHALQRDVRLNLPIRQAIAAIVMAQQPEGGWTYEPRPTQPRHDTSVTTWQILSLLSARRVGFGVPDQTFARAFDHLSRFSLPTGEVRYADIGPQAFRRTDALSASSLLCHLLYGQVADTQAAQVRLIVKNLPDWERLATLDHSMYYWYHANLAMFIIGEQPWQRWNARLQAELLARQEKTGHAAGSFPPADKWGASGGRIYSTAINLLNLEIYYRYRPAFLHPLPPATIMKLRAIAAAGK